jgi:type III pantothenate kinase
MILALDVGNSQIFGGVIEDLPNGPIIRLRFRKNSKNLNSSDEYGLFFRTVLRENGIDPKVITRVAVCSVVPDLMYSLKNAFQKYFDSVPFVLQAGVKTGLKIKYRNPLEVGADRIANSIGGVTRYPGKNLLIVDMGTATTFCGVTREKEYLGGAILAGLRTQGEALGLKTAKLPSVEIVTPEAAMGRSTIESIQSGLYFGHVGAIKEFILRYQAEVFGGERPFVIGTGGFSKLFEKEKIFDAEIPDLVLLGLFDALKMNT